MKQAGETKVIHEVAEGKHRIVLVSNGDLKPGEWVSDLTLSRNGSLYGNVGIMDLPKGVFKISEIPHQILD